MRDLLGDPLHLELAVCGVDGSHDVEMPALDWLTMDFPAVVLFSTVVPGEAWLLLLVMPSFSSFLFLVCM